MRYDDAATLTFGSVTVFPYGLTLALGAALGLALFALLARRRGLKRETVAVFCALAPLVSLAVSRAVYCLVNVEFFLSVQNIAAMLRPGDGGLSMFGALAGAALSALCAARWTKQPAAAALDALAPALMLFVCVARLGEGFVQLGFSRTLVESEFLRGSFLAAGGDYGFVLRTYLLEAAAALVICAVLCAQALGGRARRPGDGMLRAMLYFGLTQILLESLRYDKHMVWGFVGAQMVFALLTAAAALLVFARRAHRTGRAAAALAAFAALAVALEFDIDRGFLGVSRYADYAVFALLVAGMLYLGERLYRRGS